MDNPYLIARPALIAFSGGRTSGYLLKHIIDAYGGVLPEDIFVTFCNTGNEHELTLVFVAECERRWGVKIHWLEFDSSLPDKTRVVDFATAARDGSPLEDAIRSRPTQHLFNPVSRYCTTSTKARRMQKFMHVQQGYKHWFVALGLRADEMKRVEAAAKRAGRDRQYPVTPLATAGVAKLDVGQWWTQQSFDLGLPNVGGVTPMGNCVVCPLKAKGKLINVLRVMPEAAAWPIRQEDEMTERLKSTPYNGGLQADRRNRFFKDGTSYRGLLAEAQWQNEIDAPLDEGYDTGIDCFCTD